MKGNLFIIPLTALLLCMAGCKSKEGAVTTAAFHTYETECLGKGTDGRQTLRVWASGSSRRDAVEQARKKAVSDVIFKGIQAGSGDCTAYPLLDSPTVRTQHQAYFDKFFSKGGDYRKFVTDPVGGNDATEKLQGDGTLTCGIVVIIDRSALRLKLETDGIIKK